MLKIWGRVSSSNVQKVLWLCELLEIPFERTDLGGPFGGTREPSYLAKNPNALIPTIEDDGFVLWESNAILRYLAVKHGGGALYGGADPHARALVDQWLDWQITVAGPPMGPLLGQLIRTPPDKRDPAVIAAGSREAGKAWSIADQALADGRAFIGGSAFSLADIALGLNVWRWYNLPIERPATRHLDAWFGRLSAMPGMRLAAFPPGWS